MGDCEYTEAFASPPRDWACDGLRAKWCAEGVDWAGKSGCDAPGSLRITPGASETARLWYFFGDAPRPRAVRISFKYLQWEGNPPVPDLAPSYLDFRTEVDGGFDAANCPDPETFTEALWLNETFSPPSTTCAEAVYELAVDDNVQAVYWQFRKRRPSSGSGIVMLIDDLKIVTVPKEP